MRRDGCWAQHQEGNRWAGQGASGGLADKLILRRAAIGAILAGTVLLLLSMGGAILHPIPTR
jgi:hypothetical protein